MLYRTDVGSRKVPCVILNRVAVTGSHVKIVSREKLFGWQYDNKMQNNIVLYTSHAPPWSMLGV